MNMTDISRVISSTNINDLSHYFCNKELRRSFIAAVPCMKYFNDSRENKQPGDVKHKSSEKILKILLNFAQEVDLFERYYYS